MHQEFLRSVPFFKDLDDEDVLILAEQFNDVRYSPGEIIVREDTTADKFYIVEEGKVEFWKNYGNENSARLALEGRGHIFGEMSLIDELPRSATVVAHRECSLLYLEKENFKEITEKRPKIILSLLRALSTIVRKSNESFITDLSRQNEQLEKAYHDLKEAQDELIRAERFSNLGKFSSLILHDLRNPISVIRGYGEMIQLISDEPEKVVDYSKRIVQEADHLNQFASELLDYSRGEIRLNYVFTSSHMIVQKALKYISNPYKKKNIKIVVDNQSNTPFYVDEERLLRVIINLADNARKAMDAGGVLGIKSTDQEGEVRFHISDTGVGMEPEVLEKIFEPFYSSAHGGGTGLGMVSVKNIIEAHGGTIEISSTKGRGTDVFIHLPLVENYPDT